MQLRVGVAVLEKIIEVMQDIKVGKVNFLPRETFLASIITFILFIGLLSFRLIAWLKVQALVEIFLK